MTWHAKEAIRSIDANNGPTEAINNLIQRIKRIGFRFRMFAHYRIRVLLYDASPTGTTRHRHTPLRSDEPKSAMSSMRFGAPAEYPRRPHH